MTTRALARFRADPAKVRVSIRYLGYESMAPQWMAVIMNRESLIEVYRIRKTPEAALTEALEAASNRSLPGVDLDMQWTYPHPFGRYGLAKRKELT